MAEKKRKISYIKKPFARRSKIGLVLVLVGFFLCGVSLALSVRVQGQGEMDVAAWAVSSFLFAFTAMCYGGFSFLEPERNYLLARIDLIAGGILLLFWICVVIAGLLA